jgi:hypothetical protein
MRMINPRAGHFSFETPKHFPWWRKVLYYILTAGFLAVIMLMEKIGEWWEFLLEILK